MIDSNDLNVNVHGECGVCLRTFGGGVDCCCGSVESGEDVGPHDGIAVESVTYYDAKCKDCCDAPHGPSRPMGGDFVRMGDS